MEVFSPLHRDQAPHRVGLLKEIAAARLSESIRTRAWTQSEAAARLGVSQPRISDAVRGRLEKFTLDALLEMVLGLGHTVELSVGDPDDRLGAGYKSRSPQDNRALIDYWTSVIEAEPGNAKAHFNRAMAKRELNDLMGALIDFSRSVELNPAWAAPRFNRLLVYRDLGDYRTALWECRRCEELFPDWSVRQNEALIHEASGDFAEALRCYEAGGKDDETPGLYWNKARLLEKLGRWSQAAEAYRAAARLDPSCARYLEAAEEMERRASVRS